jgi:hypothetical protein
MCKQKAAKQQAAKQQAARGRIKAEAQQSPVFEACIQSSMQSV